MRFVLALHSHLPWVLHHGRWPHGSDWLCEAAVDTYLPLIAACEALAEQGVRAPITLGVTPILANQLAHPSFRTELDAFLAQRLDACEEAIATFRQTGERRLLPLGFFWRGHLRRLDRLFRRLNGDLIGALRRLADQGRLELMSSAATHGFLPLLGRDESIRLQLLLGRAEHERLFGRAPAGCWMPECAYRPAGRWQPLPSASAAEREGIEEFLSEAGYRYVFADAHQAEAGETLGLYAEPEVDAIRAPVARPLDAAYPRSPYRAYRMSARRGGPVDVLVRDPRTSLRVWSRHEGFPGDGDYLEFHKIRWPGGLKLWRVTGLQVDLGGKAPYDPNVARARAYGHARDLAALLDRVRGSAAGLGGDVVAVPFDTELFGHWWFEGVDFLADLYRWLAKERTVTPVTASGHLLRHAPLRGIRLAEGSWGANGDFSKWLNPQTAWTWERLWGLEERFWTVARDARVRAGAPHALAQAGRELLLAQASDWQFIISTGAAADYAERRFREHCDGLDRLLEGLTGNPETAAAVAQELAARNDPFPDLLAVLDEVIARS